jgi:hypothetical protein
VRLLIGPVEAVWIAITLTGVIATTASVVDAIGDRRAIKALNGHAREIVGNGNVRRESVRLAVSSILLALSVFTIFDDREIPLTPFVALLIAIPLLLTINSILDASERRKLSAILTAKLEAERTSPRRRSEDLYPGRPHRRHGDNE